MTVDFKTTTLKYIEEQRKALDELENSFKYKEPESVNPGYRYRLLTVGETSKVGDEYLAYLLGGKREWVLEKGRTHITSSHTEFRRAIEIPEGWELVPENTLIKATDKAWHSPPNIWDVNTFNVGEPANKYQAVIRQNPKLPKPPEGFYIEPTIEEMNLKIAEYMGIKDVWTKEDLIPDTRIIPRYDLSWDALIPVVLRLNRVLSNPIKIGFDLTYIRKQCYEAILKLNK